MRSSIVGIACLLLGGCWSPATHTPQKPVVQTESHPESGEKISSESKASDSANQDAARAIGTPTDTAAISEQASPSAAETGQIAQPVAEVPDQTVAAAAGQPAEIGPATDVLSVDPPSANGDDAKHSDSDQFGRERIMLLASDGPILVELRLSIDGRPHAIALEDLIETVFGQMDSDGDGKVTWEQVVSNPRFRYGQAGNLETKDAGDRQRLIRLYDNNRDGLVDRDELPRFVTRNSGGSRSFSFTTSNLFRGVNRTQSAIRRWLDVDEDGALSDEELRGASNRLRSRDDDDDDVLVLSNFKQVPNVGDGSLPNRRRVSEADSGFAIHSQTRWDLLHYALREQYAAGGTIERDHFGPFTAMYDELDENDNNKIDKSEVQRLLTVSPTVVLWARFGDRGPAESGSAPDPMTISVPEDLQALPVMVRSFGTRLVLQLPKSRIEFFVNDAGMAQPEDAQAQALFTRSDADNNGYLDEKEFPAQELPMSPQLAAADTDGDGKVFLEELRTFLKQRSAPSRSQIRVRTADAEDAFFSALDEDGDGRLISREIYGAGSRLRLFDRNQDVTIHSHEVPDCLIVGLARGNSDREAALFTPPPLPTRAPNEGTPKWFTAMDINGDGEVHRSEFLGTTEKFKSLDRDSDGFLTVSELNL